MRQGHDDFCEILIYSKTSYDTVKRSSINHHDLDAYGLNAFENPL